MLGVHPLFHQLGLCCSIVDRLMMRKSRGLNHLSLYQLQAQPRGSAWFSFMQRSDHAVAPLPPQMFPFQSGV